ncbi:hypothetical protein NIES4106_44180 [Fischerella sp. NIES-4106]|jgi:hypothetical protein|nr:hypothetical protein NIES4106_44180 [Fischerella sp. NIES-4106]
MKSKRIGKNRDRGKQVKSQKVLNFVDAKRLLTEVAYAPTAGILNFELILPG